MKTIQSIVILICSSLISSAVNAQQYLNMRQDGRIYDVDVVVFARQLSQPDAKSLIKKPLVKNQDVVTLPLWDGQQKLFQYPEVAAPPDNSVPIENQANPVRVLNDVILSTSMDHAIVNRLKVNPTYRPIYRQQWRQMPSSFRNPRYIEVSSLSHQNNQAAARPMDRFNELNEEDSEVRSEFSMKTTVPDFSIDGQVAFSSQAYNHLHVKMNLFRVDSMGQQITYQLSQQKRITLNQWQYFDHQQFGVLAKVTPVSLRKED